MRRACLAIVLLLPILVGCLLMAIPTFFLDVHELHEARSLFWHAVAPEELEIGDHVYSKRYLGLYVHHGIYAGNGTVIHFSGTFPADARIKRCTVDEFNGWQAWRIRRAMYGLPAHLLWLKMAGTAYGEPSDSPRQVMARAEELMRENKIRFSIFEYNCEGFVYYCKTGHSWRSIQADNIPLPGDLIRLHRFARKAVYWLFKVASTLLELVFTISTFEL